MSTPTPAALKSDIKVIGLVSAAHGLSHFFQLVLPPLFPLMKDEFGASYAALGAVMAVFYTVSSFAQTASGFLVDRFGARIVLLVGLALVSVGALLASLVPSIGWLYAAAAVAGLGNSVFHPADLALLNAKVDQKRLGHAFSIHGVSGNIGWALAPMFMAPVMAMYGWRVALLAAGAIGVIFTAYLATQRVLSHDMPRMHREHAARSGNGFAHSLRLLLSAPVLLCFLFFTLYSITIVGYQTFATTASTQLYDVSLVAATTALTAFLLGGAAGVLAGGFVATHSRRHNAVAGATMGAGALLALIQASGLLPGALLLPIMAMTGFVLGVSGPSRDIIVRNIAPPEARGKVYGFVYAGLDVGGLIGPLAFGFALDHGHPAWVFAGAAVFLVLSVPTVIGLRGRARVASAAANP